MATPVSHVVNFIPPDMATVLMPIGPKLRDITVGNANARYYRCNGYGHEAHKFVTPAVGGLANLSKQDQADTAADRTVMMI